MKQIQQIDSRQFYRQVFLLVLPMAVQNLINVGVTTADVVMLGKVGESVLSGASLAGQIQFILTLIYFGLTSGASVLTAQYWGKGDIKSIEKILALSLKISLACGVAFTLAALCIPEQLMRIFTSEKDVIENGAVYLRIVAFSYLPISYSMVYLNLIKSIERVIISTVVYLSSLILNIILNAILIFGLLGFPELGIKGAAIATLTARILELIITVWYAHFKNKQVKLRMKYFWKIDKLLKKDFIMFAVPVLLNELFWGTGYSANAAVIGHLGSAAVAANSVAQVMRQLSMVISLGLSGAAAIMVGKALGEKNEKKAELYGKKFLWLSLAAGICGGLLILISRGFLPDFMNLTQISREYLLFMLIVMAYYTVAQAINTTSVVGLFRGGGDTRFGLILDVSSMWGGSILFGAVAAFVLKWPVYVVFVILMSDEIIKLLPVYIRYRSKKWVRNITREL